MNKIFVQSVILIFSLLNLQLVTAKEAPIIVVGQTPLPAESNKPEDEMNMNFARVAMAEFKELDATGLSDPQIKAGIYKYSTQMAKILLDAGISPQTISTIMEKAASWYGQALVAIYSGGNLQEVVQEYTYKITDVFLKHQLGIPVQSGIVSLTTENLDAQAGLFRDLKK